MTEGIGSMERRVLRVSLALERDVREDELLAALEEALGRPPELVWKLRGSRVLSCRMTAEEMETVRGLPGIRSVQPEQRADLPPRPRIPQVKE